MTQDDQAMGTVKGAELISGSGAIILGGGLALVLPEWFRSYATPLLIGGAVVHGLGMTLKYRLEFRRGPPHLDCSGRAFDASVRALPARLTLPRWQG